MLIQGIFAILFYAVMAGVVSAILLKLCGVSEEDIVYDYMLTRACNRKRFELIHQNYPEVDMRIVIPDEGYMKEFLRLFQERFQDVEGYFEAVGVTREETALIVRKMLTHKGHASTSDSMCAEAHKIMV